MSTVTDYVGRTVDVAAFRGIFPSSQEQLLAQELVSSQDGGALLAGIEKLAQKVLTTLLKKKGSQQYRPDDGTDFMADAEAGRWRTVADVTQSFLFAQLDVSRQLTAEELSTDPPDEQFAGLTLDSVTLNGTTVTVRMTLTSRAGSAYTFLTPLTVAIR